ncbi:MAG: alpha-L-fucosidase [Phycisphaeraceae bacterium]|nr:MAG: alpha-L-fucosidase [Phycisphaeraceae bacterium]
MRRTAIHQHLSVAFAALAVAGAATLGEPGRLNVEPPRPYGPTPSAAQLAWHELEMNAFVHFTINTFTDREWGEGDEPPRLFNPTDFDADQIVGTFADAGFGGVILTCKHHDGFCLWPTETTAHSIEASPWRGGKGDMVREIADAATRHGVRFGVYVSPWDRNNALYGTPEYVTEVYRPQLRELLNNYGDIFEVWFDGANGGTGYYGGANEERRIDRQTYYHWDKTWAMVRTLAPNAVMFSDVGPGCRWIGNERGIAGDPCWATYTPRGPDGEERSAPGMSDYRQSPTGTRDGAAWIPGECDVSIRPGWFWHENENDKVRGAANLMDLYLQSVGRGANLLLNVPPDRRGCLHENDVANLHAFGEHLRATFGENLAIGATFDASDVRGEDPDRYGPARLVDADRWSAWTTDDNVRTAEVIVTLSEPRTFNMIRLREDIRLGQRVRGVSVDAWVDGTWSEVASAESVGASRIWRVGAVTTDRVRVRVTEAAACPALSDFGLYQEPLPASP